VVDVPGHERFVRTMVAGASGVDLYLLCVAADDGVMPQTREHLAVLRQLGVDQGVVAITKADLGDPEAAAKEVADLVPGAQAVPVSVTDGRGLDALRAAVDRVAAALPSRADSADPPRLHVDRSFTLKGIGTVVTGTLWSGSVAAGDTVRILPRGLEARVRSVQVHDRPLERAAAGQRVALNLSGVGWRELGRGDVVSSPGAELEPTYLVDAVLSLERGAEPLRRGERLHVHHGTREAPARVVPLGEDFAQLRLEAPLVPAAGDRLVLRRLAPPDTVGGGVVVDAHPRKHGPGAEVVERLHALRRGDLLPEPDAPREEAPPPEPTPLDEAALRLASLLRSDGERPRTDAELAAAAGLEAAEAGRRLRALEHAGQAVRVGRNLHFDPEALDRIISRVLAICEREGAATIAGVRDELGTSRKYAQVVLEHLDAAKITRRRGDEHVLRG
jgi:selenocysteine-specific elongation factor